MTDASDTFARSCAHWSEAGRAEMEAFYALATLDYRELATVHPWRSWLEAQQYQVGDRSLRLLDVACGSGKFPQALVHYADVATAHLHPIDYHLLDPSAFSLAEAARALTAPFVAGRTFETTLQDFAGPAGTYDIVWATHALYALPAAELTAGLGRFVQALRPGGVGFIAHAAEDAHYLRFYRQFLQAFHGGRGTPYTGAEAITAALADLGVAFEVRMIHYHNGASDAERSQVEGYLQRCVFDDRVSLVQMLEHPTTGAYLAECLQGGQWRFAQEVALIFIRPAGGEL
ncbi:MAG: class I SAM-dependent methyltransferase [Candidatus Competibacterales bacterium]